MRKDTGLIVSIVIGIVLVLAGLVHLISQQAPVDPAGEPQALTVPSGDSADDTLPSWAETTEEATLHGEVVDADAGQVTVRTAGQMEMTFSIQDSTRVTRGDMVIEPDSLGPGETVTVSYLGTGGQHPVAQFIAVGIDAEA